ncbi:MAG: hypothetical protein ISN29_04520 [Gammaproteobacteria bacterium AqS3]|nr:hypothetical protein [Gammaproteobacteria bacterium AqS3]
MNRQEQLKLQRDVQGEHHDLECSKIIPVQFPCWKYEADILVSTRSGPDTLDKVFMGLIKNGVNTKKELAKVLGVDDREFIFQHLGLMADQGYVELSQAGAYQLTALGDDFEKGEHKEERIEERSRQTSKPYLFVWDCASGELSDSFDEIVIGKKPKKASSAKFLKYPKPPSEADIEDELSQYFNEHPENEKDAFYSVLPVERPRRWLRWHEARWKQEYAVLFYVPKGRDTPGDIKHIEVRRRVQSANVKFELCEELTGIIKSRLQPEWYEQLEDFYSKEPKLQ